MDLATENKKELTGKVSREFQNLDSNNKMFVLGYMMGVQQNRQDNNQKTKDIETQPL